MFKGIQNKLKRKAALKTLKGKMGQMERPDREQKGIRAIACIVDLDRFDRPESFFDFIEEYGLRPNAVKVIGYRKQYDKNSPYATPVFSDKDLGWNGNVENGYVLEFLNREYDLLVNYFNDRNLMPSLISTKVRARYRIGFQGSDQDINDLILDIPLQDFKLFKLELTKYLRVFNELEVEKKS